MHCDACDTVNACHAPHCTPSAVNACIVPSLLIKGMFCLTVFAQHLITGKASCYSVQRTDQMTRCMMCVHLTPGPLMLGGPMWAALISDASCHLPSFFKVPSLSMLPQNVWGHTTFDDANVSCFKKWCRNPGRFANQVDLCQNKCCAWSCEPLNVCKQKS